MTEPTERNDDRTTTPERDTTDDGPDRRDAAGGDDGTTRRRRRGSRGGRGRGRSSGDAATSGAEAGDASADDAGSGSGTGRSRDAGRSRDTGRSGDDSGSGDDGGPGGDDRGAGGGSGSGSDDDGTRRRRRGRRGRRGRGGGSGGGGASTDGGASDGPSGRDDATASREGGSADRSAADDRSQDRGSEDGGSKGAGRERASKGAPAEDGSSKDGSSKDGSSSRGGSSRGGSKDGGSSKGGGSKDGGSSKGGSGKGGSSRGGSSKGGGGNRSAEDEATAEAIAKGGTRVAAKQRGKRGGNGGGGGNGRGRGGQRPGGVPEEVRRAILEGPPRTMLVTNREDRTQIAVLEDRTVCEHYVTRKKDVTFVGNIYMARVQNVLPGMEAAFLDIGKGRNGVLYAGEVLYDELDLEEGADERIENALKPGQKVLVQVTKDPMGSKGPRLTMHLSLAGRYSVLAPNSDLFGISRKLTDKERDRLRRIVKKVKPDHHGVIVRTAAENASEDQLTADLERLLAKWARVEEAAAEAKALTPVYEEPPLVVKVIRDNFGPEFERCIVDDEDLYHQVRGYLDEVAPELSGKVELYGQPTADARARAAGAPALEDASADPTTADAATVVPDADAATSDSEAGSEGTEADAAEARSDAAATDRWDTEGGHDGPDAEADGAQAEGAAAPQTAGSGEAGSTPVAADDAATVVATTVDVEAARARREQLPRLFDAYDVTDQLRKATSRKVWLPSGGYLIIESTEAMKVIDVNSGKFTGSGDMNLEEVVLRTNLEAADEIVRQLRLRDMGGIIVIDFIDMLLKANQEQVVRRLKRELLRDRTKTRVSEVSRLGLVQMTRKNVSQGLVEAFSHSCEHCEGRGLISELD